MQVKLPMTSNGLAGYVAPRSLEEGRTVSANADLQRDANSAIRATRDVVDFLLSKNVADGQEVQAGGVVTSIPHNDFDLNPDPNIVVLGGAAIDCVNRTYYPSGEKSADAFLQVSRPKNDPHEDSLSLVQNLQLSQSDGWNISMTTVGRQDNISYDDGNGTRLEIIRDHSKGILTVMAGDPK